MSARRRAKSQQTQSADGGQGLQSGSAAQQDNSVAQGQLGRQQDAGAALKSGRQGGRRGALPYQRDLESFFGQPLDHLSAWFGAGQGLSELDANAAQQGTDVVFKQDRPPREVVAEEVAHALQDGPSAPTTTTSPQEGAELEAKEAGKAFAAGGQAGELSQRKSGVARDEETGTTLDQLREAADGSWWGNVDESLCLRLIGELSASEQATVREDRALMRKLAGAFNEDEILLCVNMLDFALVWKAYWIVIAGEESSVSVQSWQGLITGATQQERIDLIGWSSFGHIQEVIGLDILGIFAAERADGTWGGLIASTPAIATALLAQLDAPALIAEVGGAHIDEGDIPGIVTALSAGWASTLAALPTGSGLSSTSRTALRRIAGTLDVDPARALFEKRFNASTEGRFEDSGGNSAGSSDPGAVEITWSHGDLMEVWDVLDVLPDQDVADNTVIRAWQAISGNRGFYSGPMANQERSGTIKLGEDLDTSADPERLAHTVMHEVGHAVHRRINGTVNPWLQQGVGFWYFAEGSAGWTSLITDLGGWPSTYENLSAVDVAFGETEKARILELLVAHGGNQKWTSEQDMPDITTVAPAEGFVGPPSPDQTDALLWRAMPEKMRTCIDLSSPKWYQNYATLPSGPKGQYCFNHWYGQPFYFSGDAKTAIDATGDDYSAMSHKEFFANCYAEFFKDPAGYNDNSLWGGSLNAPVQDFMRSHVLERQPYTPPGEGGAGDVTEDPSGSDGTRA